MIKAILFFGFVWALAILGVRLFRAATNKERWAATKIVAFGFVTALIAVAVVSAIVAVF